LKGLEDHFSTPALSLSCREGSDVESSLGWELIDDGTPSRSVRLLILLGTPRDVVIRMLGDITERLVRDWPALITEGGAL
jgi:hypothetical protein